MRTTLVNLCSRITQFERVDQFQSASYSYRKAASLAKDARQKNDYKNAAERLRSKIQAAVDGRMSEARTLDKDSMGLQKLRTLEAQGHTYPHDSAVWRHCWVTKGIKECWEVLMSLSFQSLIHLLVVLSCRGCKGSGL